MTDPVVVAQAPHTVALEAALEDAGIRVVRDLPDDPAHGWSGGQPGIGTFQAYCQVFPIPGGSRFGTIAEPEQDATLLFQVTCVAATRAACEELVDAVSAAAHHSNWEVPGRSIERVIHDYGSAHVRPVDDPEPTAPSLWVATPRFRVISYVDRRQEESS